MLSLIKFNVTLLVLLLLSIRPLYSETNDSDRSSRLAVVGEARALGELIQQNFESILIRPEEVIFLNLRTIKPSSPGDGRLSSVAVVPIYVEGRDTGNAFWIFLAAFKILRPDVQKLLDFDEPNLVGKKAALLGYTPLDIRAWPFMYWDRSHVVENKIIVPTCAEPYKDNCPKPGSITLMIDDSQFVPSVQIE